MADTTPLKAIEPIARTSVTDQIYETLYQKVLTVELPPGTKLSEADVAKQLGVSRQPVRDAFFRLSKLGFLQIQPQRATTVTRISARMVGRARFIRTAIEVAVVREACKVLTEADFAELDAILAAQLEAIEAGDKNRFHALDDGFHQRLCELIGHGHAYEIIREAKAHTDRLRLMSLAYASRTAFEDHREIMRYIRSRDADGAADCIRTHLARIEDTLAKVRAENHSWFVEEE
ncbi:MAG: GntR family transcriptional regulator [Rhodobacteraceae bacterium]|nr:GntR family transcriptional regulator [Paracoccaceae bacterium]